MFAKKIFLKGLVLSVSLFMLSASTALSQDFCEGDFDYDGDVDGMDALGFKADFGRRQDGSNPCPPDGPAPVPKTGNTNDVTTGEDGDLQMGVTWPVPRFTANVDNDGDGNCDNIGIGETCDGTVTDNLTGLIWLRNAGCMGSREWSDAISTCNTLSHGDCSNTLLDSSSPGDWRLPNVNELASLIDRSIYNPALSPGYPFDNVQSNYYWSSTSYAYVQYAWGVNFHSGSVSYPDKSDDISYVWCVRGGQ